MNSVTIPPPGPDRNATDNLSVAEDFATGTLIKRTRSICPECLEPLDAGVFERDGQVWLDKECPAHGMYSALMSSDSRFYYEPQQQHTADRGASCCAPAAQDTATSAATAAEEAAAISASSCCTPGSGGNALINHSCNILFEITERCNLSCPTCYAGSSPHLSKMMDLAEFTRQADLLVENGKSGTDVIQLSGGEPTVHPDLLAMIDVLVQRGFPRICINTNGIKLAAKDFVDKLVAIPGAKLSVYLQFDGFEEHTHQALRGRGDLLKLKRKALEHCLAAGIQVHPVMTLTRGINDHEVGDFLNLAVTYPEIKDVIIQPAMYSGRYDNPRRIDRLTLADTVALVCQQFGVFNADDFSPIPCSHPNCFGMAVAVRGKAGLIPVSRYFPRYQSWAAEQNQALIDRVTDTINAPRAMSEIMRWAAANGDLQQVLKQLDEEEVEQLLERVIAWQQSAQPRQDEQQAEHADQLTAADVDTNNRVDGKANGQAAGQNSASIWDDLLLVNIKPFMDAYTYDQDRIDKCCVHILDPQGRPISFCEYNAIHRPRMAERSPLATKIV